MLTFRQLIYFTFVSIFGLKMSKILLYAALISHQVWQNNLLSWFIDALRLKSYSVLFFHFPNIVFHTKTTAKFNWWILAWNKIWNWFLRGFFNFFVTAFFERIVKNSNLLLITKKRTCKRFHRNNYHQETHLDLIEVSKEWDFLNKQPFPHTHTSYTQT